MRYIFLYKTNFNKILQLLTSARNKVFHYFTSLSKLSFLLTLSFSSLTCAMEIASQDKQETILQAHRKIFESCLEDLKNDESFRKPLTFFICYSGEDKSHQAQIKNLASDLVRSGVLEEDIYYDERVNKSGLKYTIHQYLDSIFNTDKIIVIGSKNFKEQYEGGKGFTFQAIENLKTRITKKGVQGIIPICFEGKQEDNFPTSLENIFEHCFREDYFLSFFDLLMKIYELSPIDNLILTTKEKFSRLRDIPQDMLQRYGGMLLQYQQMIFAQNEAEREKILFSRKKVTKKASIQHNFSSETHEAFERVLAENKIEKEIKCFIAYAHGIQKHENLVRQLANHLKIFGLFLYIDIDNYAGSNVSRFIENIFKCDYIILVGSNNLMSKRESDKGATINMEISMIFEQQRKRPGSIIPILIEGDKESSFPFFLHDLIYLDFRNYENNYYGCILQIFNKLLYDQHELLDRIKKFISENNDLK